MWRAWIRAAGAAIVAAPASAQVSPPSIDQIFQTFAAVDGPGCALGVARSGRPPLLRAFGGADLEHAIPIRTDTVFEAGSASKQFTAAAILLLVEEGRLSLRDDIRRFIPELPDYGRTITIDHLLNHMSGLRDWSTLVAIAGRPRMTRVYSQADALDIIVRQRALNFEPGVEYSYTNSGYVLLAELVQRVTGESFVHFTSSRIFAPLGMSATRWRDNFRTIVPNRAIAYQRSADGAWEQAMPFENVYGPSGLLTTIGDLLIWNEALATGRLGARVTARLQEPSRLADGRRTAYARGLYVETFRGTEEVSHEGATGGYRAWIGRYPSHRLSLAILCNAAQADTPQLAHAVAGTLLPEPPPAAGPAETTGDAAGRAGLFVNQRTGVPFRLELRDGRLSVVGGPNLRQTSADRFALGTQTFRFLADDELEATSGNAPPTLYRRAAAFGPTLAELEAFAGRYRSDEIDAVYTVRAAEGGLIIVTERTQSVFRVAPVYRDAFIGPLGLEVLIRFRRGPSGVVNGLSVGGGRVRELSFDRLGD